MLAALGISAHLPAQNPPSDSNVTPASNGRILGVIPNFLTVNDPQQNIPQLTVKQKFALFYKETADPFTVVAAAAGAGLSEAPNDDPKYGQGGGAYADRFGAAVADIATQNFFQDALLASVLHEDPRYFRRGPQFPFLYRVRYSMTRVVITRTDAGKPSFNYSGIGGMALGIALSNAYYPSRSVNGAEVAMRFGTSLAASAFGNILPEFWPDIRQKFFHRK